MTTYQEENIIDIVGELKHLISLHWNEIGVFDKVKVPLDPDWAAYAYMHQDGNFKTYTVRDDMGMLVGYIGFIIRPMLHYKSTLIAKNDLVFLHPDVRKGLTGYRLIKFAVEEVKKVRAFNMPVKIVSLDMKVIRPFEKIAERLGFKMTDYVFHMEVD